MSPRSRHTPWRRRRVAGHSPGQPEEERWPSHARIYHLEFIQDVISRLATNSFVTKGWCLTVAGAIYGFAANHLNPWIASVGLIPTLGFWWLDAYFLRQERLFRCLYDDARQPDTPVALFSMHIVLYKSNAFVRWRRVAFSLTLLLFYGMIFLAGLAILAAGIAHEVNQEHSRRTSSAISSKVSSERSGLAGQMSPIWSSCHRGTR
jgi:hypothetical protein